MDPKTDPKTGAGEKNGRDKMADVAHDIAEIRIDAPESNCGKVENTKPESKPAQTGTKNNDLKKQESKRNATLTKKNSFDRSFDGDKKEGNGKGRLRKERSFESVKKDSPGGRNSDKKYEGSGKSGGGRNPKLGRRMGSEEGSKSEGEGIPRLRRQQSQEETETPRRKGYNKKFLPRSQQVSDDASPPSTPELNFGEDDKRIHVRRLPHQLSGETPSNRVHKQASLEARSEPALSREPSQEREIYKDSTGVDLHQFIVETLQKANDRTMLLKLENELTRFIGSDDHMLKFPPMTSYHRMIVHRVAAYFGLDHNVDQSGKAVVVNKTPNTRIPEQKFREHIKEEPLESKKILKRSDTASFDDKDEDSQDKCQCKEDKRSKSFEERNEEYEKARARIFNPNNVTESLTVEPSPTRPKSILQASSRQNSGTSDDSSSSHWQKDRPWSSVDSSGSDRPSNPAVTKASSFAGSLSTKLMRNDSSASSRSSSSLGSRGSLSKLHPMDSVDRGAGSPHGQVRGFAPSFTYQPTLGPISQVPAPAPIPQQPPSPYSSQPSLQQGPQVTWTSSLPMGTGAQPYQAQPHLHHIPSQQGQGQPHPSQPHPSQTGGTHGGVPVIVQQGAVQRSAGPGTGQQFLFATDNLESVPPGSYIINPQTGSPYMNQDGTPMVVQATPHPQPPSSSQLQPTGSGHNLPTQAPPQQLVPSQQGLVQHTSPMVSSSSHPTMAGYSQPLGGVGSPTSPMGFGQTPSQGAQGVIHSSYQTPHQQPAMMLPHQHSGDYPELSLPLQGLTLHRQVSGGDSDSLPGVSGSHQHIPLPQQQQQQGGAQQSSSGTQLAHPQAPQQQPPLLQLQHQPGMSQPGLSQPGLSQPYLVRQISGGSGVPGSSPQAPTANQAQQAQALGQQQQGIPPATQQVIFSGQPQQGPPFRQPTPAQIYSPQTVQSLPQSQAHTQQPAQSSQNPQLVQPPGTIMYPSNQQGGGSTPQGYYTTQGFPGMGLVSPQQGPSQTSGQPQIIYQAPLDQPPSSQQVPVLYQSQAPHYAPTLASPGDVPRSTSPSTQPMHSMTVVMGQQQGPQPGHQMLTQPPGVLAGQRPQSPQIIGVPYSQSVPCTGPGSASGPGLLSQTVMYNPVHQRRGMSLEQQQQHGVRPRELYAPGMGLLSHSPGTSPSQSPGPPLQRTGMPDKGMRPSLKSTKQAKAPRRQRKVQQGDSMMMPESLEAHGADMLEVCPMSGETTCGAILANLEDLTRLGADLRWLPVATPASQALHSHQVDHSDRCSNYVVIAMFPVPEAAQSALVRHVNPSYVLRPPERDYSVRLSLASSSSSSSSPLPPLS